MAGDTCTKHISFPGGCVQRFSTVTLSIGSLRLFSIKFVQWKCIVAKYSYCFISVKSQTIPRFLNAQVAQLPTATDIASSLYVF